MSKILIKCDLCGKFKDAKQTKRAEANTMLLFLYDPVMDGKHFICYDCLNKLGWNEESEEETHRG